MFIDYKDQGDPLEAFVAAPSHEEKRPLVILCHAWKGRDDFICKKALEVAGWGYTAFALDMYGKGILGSSKEENAALKRPFIEDRSFLQRRVLRAFEVARCLPHVSEVAVLGFGFGGLCALDLARSGVNLKGTVSIYGHLEPPSKEPRGQIQGKVLVLHGSKDPIVSQESLRSFEKEMNEQNVDWQTHIYGGAGHAFANPEAGNLYHPIAALRAWDSTRHFLNEIFL